MLVIIAIIGAVIFLVCAKQALDKADKKTFRRIIIFLLSLIGIIIFLRFGSPILAAIAAVIPFIGRLSQLLAIFRIFNNASSMFKGTRRANKTNNSMKRSEAYHILGLAPGASPHDIKKAYQQKMKEHHPDKGGDQEVAAKLNMAKSLLLGKKKA